VTTHEKNRQAASVSVENLWFLSFPDLKKNVLFKRKKHELIGDMQLEYEVIYLLDKV